MFLNGVFLGVCATEEVVPVMRVIEELEGCVGDGGCGGVIAEPLYTFDGASGARQNWTLRRKW
jgi:hypothetical protein